jgi:hypothetical protein
VYKYSYGVEGVQDKAFWQSVLMPQLRNNDWRNGYSIADGLKGYIGRQQAMRFGLIFGLLKISRSVTLCLVT